MQTIGERVRSIHSGREAPVHEKVAALLVAVNRADSRVFTHQIDVFRSVPNRAISGTKLCLDAKTVSRNRETLALLALAEWSFAAGKRGHSCTGHGFDSPIPLITQLLCYIALRLVPLCAIGTNWHG